MTTIGYGTFTATTVGARLVVFTAGFFSVLMFTAVSGNSGEGRRDNCFDYKHSFLLLTLFENLSSNRKYMSCHI